VQPNNKYLKLFFDANYTNFAEIFRGSNEILTKLSGFDSLHKETYRSAMN
jgi:hypothetical protein